MSLILSQAVITVKLQKLECMHKLLLNASIITHRK